MTTDTATAAITCVMGTISAEATVMRRAKACSWRLAEAKRLRSCSWPA